MAPGLMSCWALIWARLFSAVPLKRRNNTNRSAASSGCSVVLCLLRSICSCRSVRLLCRNAVEPTLGITVLNRFRAASGKKILALHSFSQYFYRQSCFHPALGCNTTVGNRIPCCSMPMGMRCSIRSSSVSWERFFGFRLVNSYGSIGYLNFPPFSHDLS